MMFLIELFVRWKLMKRMKIWNRLTNTHFYVTDNKVIELVKQEGKK